MRVRCNCDRKDCYDVQVDILIVRFIEKGYNSKVLEKTKKMVADMSTEDLLKEKETSRKDFGVAFMTGFTRQNKQIEKIIIKLWPILLKDVELRKYYLIGGS